VRWAPAAVLPLAPAMPLGPPLPLPPHAGVDKVWCRRTSPSIFIDGPSVVAWHDIRYGACCVAGIDERCDDDVSNVILLARAWREGVRLLPSHPRLQTMLARHEHAHWAWVFTTRSHIDHFIAVLQTCIGIVQVGRHRWAALLALGPSARVLNPEWPEDPVPCLQMASAVVTHSHVTGGGASSAWYAVSRRYGCVTGHALRYAHQV
jgi:hypothetical protein